MILKVVDVLFPNAFTKYTPFERDDTSTVFAPLRALLMISCPVTAKMVTFSISACDEMFNMSRTGLG